MSRLPIPTLALAVVLTACGGGDEPAADLGPLADQADRVARLIDEGRGCDAVDALAELRTLAQQDVPDDVRDAVTGFTTSAEQAVTCQPPPTEEPAERGDDRGPPDDTGPPDDVGPPDDEGRGGGPDRGDDDDEDDDDD